MLLRYCSTCRQAKPKAGPSASSRRFTCESCIADGAEYQSTSAKRYLTPDERLSVQMARAKREE